MAEKNRILIVDQKKINFYFPNVTEIYCKVTIKSCDNQL